MNRTKNKFLKIIALSIIMVLTNIVSIYAGDIDKDSCHTFVTSNSYGDYTSCSKQVKKEKEEHSNNYHQNVQWLNDPEIQLKFLHNVTAGKREYISLAFDTIPLLDGDVAEAVFDSLGKSIKVAPVIFLINLKDHLSEINKLKAFPSLIAPTGPDYVDDVNAKIAEIKKRIDAIKTVNDHALEAVKEMLLSALDKELIKYSKFK